MLGKTLESPLDCKEIKPVNPKGNQPWILTGRADAKADSLEKTLMLGKIEGKRRRGWDGWMASPTQWTRVWADSGMQWRTGKPGMLQFTGLQRVRDDLPAEQFSPKLSSHPGCHITSSRISSAIYRYSLVIHSKYNYNSLGFKINI